MTMEKIKNYATEGFNWFATVVGKSMLVSFLILVCLYVYLTFGKYGVEISFAADKGHIIGGAFLVWIGVFVTMITHDVKTTFTK